MTVPHKITSTDRSAELLGLIEHLITQLDTPPTTRTAKLTAAPTAKKARKLVEEATEVALDAVAGNRDGLITESADLLYHLAVLWHDRGVSPQEIRAEMARRAAVLGIPEKLPKKGPDRKRLARTPRRADGPSAIYRTGDRIGPVTLSGALG